MLTSPPCTPTLSPTSPQTDLACYTIILFLEEKNGPNITYTHTDTKPWDNLMLILASGPKDQYTGIKNSKNLNRTEVNWH